MVKNSTPLKITFFILFLAGFIVIQYSWVSSLQKDKLQEFKSHIISGIDGAAQNIPFTGSLHTLTETAIANTLHRSFSAQGLGDIRFEFSIGSGNNHLASRGFTKKLTGDPGHLIFHYVFHENDKKGLSNDLLTVVIPVWKKFAFKEMGWIIAASLFLTIMMLVIFCCVFILGERRQQLFYDNRTNAITNMMKQLETPLSTMSVAAEALRNTRVMHDSGRINYYQQIITEENKRMNEQVKKFLRDLE